MLILLLGKSGCGKSTIEKILENKCGFDRCISYTTRPPRDGETNMVDYFFVNDEVFNIYKHRGEFMETSTYPIRGFGLANYGLRKNSLDGYNKDKNYVLITEVNGFRQLKEKLDMKQVVVIYVQADDEVRKQRFMNRDSNSLEAEWERRLKLDNELFNEELINECDLMFVNDGDDVKALETTLVSGFSRLLKGGINK